VGTEISRSLQKSTATAIGVIAGGMTWDPRTIPLFSWKLCVSCDNKTRTNPGSEKSMCY